jgi:hypothetical protein
LDAELGECGLLSVADRCSTGGLVGLGRRSGREDIALVRRLGLLSSGLDTGLDEICSGEGDVVGWTVVLDLCFDSLAKWVSVMLIVGMRRGSLTFLISDPAKPVKALARSDAATSLAFPR